MRYLTRGWYVGELSDDETEAAKLAYWARIAAIEDRLPEPMVRLARHVDLHDGVIERVTWDPAEKHLMLDVVTSTPKLPETTQTVRAAFGGALMGKQRIDTLRHVARDREACILYWEIDVDDRETSLDAPLTLRLLFWPRDEVSIDFAELTLDIQDRIDGRVQIKPYFVEVFQDEDETD